MSAIQKKEHTSKPMKGSLTKKIASGSGRTRGVVDHLCMTVNTVWPETQCAISTLSRATSRQCVDHQKKWEKFTKKLPVKSVTMIKSFLEQLEPKTAIPG